MNASNIPESFICPISHAVMIDPVVDKDGNSYEKLAILDWLQLNNTSPITRNILDSTMLVPNRALKAMIEDFNKKNTKSTKSPSLEISPKRPPLMIFAVIDNSGSMIDSSGTNANGEKDGYTRLDLVKHTLNTIIASLSKEDLICIIKFSTRAEIFSQTMPMTEPNKLLLRDKLSFLEPEGQTNLWDGIRLAIDKFAEIEEKERYNSHIYLLTDGEPNINPPNDIVTTVRNYLQIKCKNEVDIIGGKPPVYPTINTFGYGYRLQSQMLYDLSRIGNNGIFGFIPDGTMVGTIFINALSFSLLLKNNDKKPLTNEIVVGGVVQEVIKEFKEMLERVLFRNEEKEMNVYLFLSYIESVRTVLKNQRQISKATNPNFFEKWGKHYLLSVLSAFNNNACINFKDKCIQNFKTDAFTEEQQRIEMLFIKLSPPKPSNPRGATDVNRVVNIATSYYNTCGGCFSPCSLLIAANNNKNNIENSKRVVGNGMNENTSLTCNTKNIDKNNIPSNYDDFKPIEAKNLKKNMIVWSLDGWTEVECIVKLKYTGDLYKVQNMFLTAYHPVLLANEAFFPCEINEKKNNTDKKINNVDMNKSQVWKDFDDYVYDVVLKNRSLIACYTNDNNNNYYNNINNKLPSQQQNETKEKNMMYVATFGHKKNSIDKKFYHEYFGDEKIVNDLKKHEDYFDDTKNVVQLDEYVFERDVMTNLVSNLKF